MSVEVEVEVLNKLGLHARPAAMLVRQAMGSQSEVYLEKDGERVNAKSIMSIMGFAACKGTSIRIIADGPDEKDAVDSLANLFKDKFGEE
ncbi:MAG: HPr family phosphocarrier protein [Lentisphaerales bacterium]|nr:HPr family phosphocarrier protein [Lentisphaerales bacterium]